MMKRSVGKDAGQAANVIRSRHKALRIIETCAVFVLLAFALTGCFVTDPVRTTVDDARDAVNDARDAVGEASKDVQDAANSVSDALGGIADAPQALKDMFAAAGEFTKMESAVVYDAKTGEEIATVEDAQTVQEVAARLNLVRMVSSHPDSSTAEYQISFTQNATIKLGESAEDAKRVETITFTTYRDSNVIEIYIPAASEYMNTFDFEATDEFVQALRGLASA